MLGALIVTQKWKAAQVVGANGIARRVNNSSTKTVTLYNKGGWYEWLLVQTVDIIL